MISIINYNSERFYVNFPLLYLHGHLLNDVTGDVIFDGTDDVITCINNTLQSEQIWPVNEGEFKIFCFLNDGDNEILLKWGANDFKQLNVTYMKQAKNR